MQTIPEICFEEISGRDGNLGLITLTRTHVLNAINHSMFQVLNTQLTEWEGANHIKAVIIRAAEGRAFCAGGDIRYAYERKLANDPNLVDFFRDEYQVNRRIHHFSKPYIALLNGITIGGGVGLSIHASHRVATDQLIFSMPETGIGFFPDVGTLFFLSRLPYKIGFYLGLTGVRISCDDCMNVGLIDYVVKPDVFPDLIYQLADSSFESDVNASVGHIIQKFSTSTGTSALWEKRTLIEECFSKSTMENIMFALENQENTWCQEIAALLKTKSPTSLKVTLKGLQQAATQDFDDCIEMDERLMMQFIKGPDFFEGIRAAIIDKDQTPRWQPATLKKVAPALIKKFFEPLEK